MPTLPAMPDRFPKDVLQGPPLMPQLWWVARTKPRQEKKLARWLAASKLGYFLPLRRRVRDWRGRKIRSEEPLLPGYVFLLADKDQATRAFASGAVAERLAVHDQAALFHELLQVDRLCSLGRALREQAGLAEGREVELKAGPCRGMRGVVMPGAGNARFVVSLAILGRNLEITLDPAEVEPL